MFCLYNILMKINYYLIYIIIKLFNNEHFLKVNNNEYRDAFKRVINVTNCSYTAYVRQVYGIM